MCGTNISWHTAVLSQPSFCCYQYPVKEQCSTWRSYHQQSGRQWGNSAKLGSMAWKAPFIFSLYLQMVSRGCVDTELCKSPCLQCGLNRSMCGPKEVFEVLGALPIRTTETHLGQPPPRPVGLGICALQHSLHRNTHKIWPIVLSSPASLLFFGVCGFLIFWEHPVCVLNATGHSLFSLRPLTIPALLLVWQDKTDRLKQKRKRPWTRKREREAEANN